MYISEENFQNRRRVLTSVLEPWPGSGDVVGVLDLDKDPHVGQVSADPLVEGGETLHPVRDGRHVVSNGICRPQEEPGNIGKCKYVMTMTI